MFGEGMVNVLAFISLDDELFFISEASSKRTLGWKNHHFVNQKGSFSSSVLW